MKFLPKRPCEGDVQTKDVVIIDFGCCYRLKKILNAWEKKVSYRLGYLPEYQY